MSDSSYRDIWKAVLSWSEDKAEISLLHELEESEGLFRGKEKPILNGSLQDFISQTDYTCDLIWKQSKTVFLTLENQDIVSTIHDSGWNCLCSTASIDEILKNISEV